MTPECRHVVRLDVGEGRLEHAHPRDHHDIETRSDPVTPKSLSYQTFSSIPQDSAPQLLGGSYPEAAIRIWVGEDKQRAIPALDPRAPLVHPLKFDAPTDARVPIEPAAQRQLPVATRLTLTSYCERVLALLAADSQAFAPFRPTSFEDQSALFRAHPDQEPVRPLSPACIGLKRPFAFHAAPFAALAGHGSERILGVSIAPGLCYSRRPPRVLFFHPS